MKRLFATFCMLLCVMGSYATYFIKDVYVVIGSTEAEAKQAMPTGYGIIDRNVNRNGGGSYVYIGYQFTTNKSEALTDVLIVKKGSTALPTRITKNDVVYTKASSNSNGNLNYGRSGADVLYLYKSTTGNASMATSAISGIFVESSSTALDKDSYACLYDDGDVTSSADLNAGGSATEHHYLKTAKHSCSVTFTKTSTTHSGTCSECGHVVTNENHTLAWRDTGTYCQQYCTECSYATQNTNHDQKGFSPISDSNSEYHYICCSRCKAVVTTAPHTLTYTATSSSDTHFAQCSKCSWEGDVAHAFGSYTNSPATNNHTATCSKCSYVDTKDHDFSTFRSLSNLQHLAICSVCNASGEATVHEKVVDYAEVPATCLASGFCEAWHCSSCTYRVNRAVVNALGHDMTQYLGYDATCTVPGARTYYHCNRCGGNYQAHSGGNVATQDWITIAAKHDTPVHKQRVDAACTTDGVLENWYCGKCKNYYTDKSLSEESLTTSADLVLPATGHDYTDNNGFCLACDGYEPAPLNEEDSYYEISNAGQLYWFSELCATNKTGYPVRLKTNVRVNARVLGEDGKLDQTAAPFRAWIPIKNFNSTFDGGGNAISGLYYSSTKASSDYMASLFHAPVGAQILNTTIDDSYFCSYYSAAAFASGADAECSIQNCHNKAHIYATYYGAAGIVSGKASVENCTNQGHIEAIFQASGIGGDYVTNCGNMGSVIAQKSSAGISYTLSDGSCYIKNCFNTGDVSITGYPTYDTDKAYALSYGSSYSGAIISDCYALEGGAALYNTFTTKTNVGTMSAVQFRSGEVCFKLNANNPAGTSVWGQDIFVDRLPQLQGPAVSYNEARSRYCNPGVVKTVGTLTKRITDLQTGNFTTSEVDVMVDTMLER